MPSNMKVELMIKQNKQKQKHTEDNKGNLNKSQKGDGIVIIKMRNLSFEEGQ